MSVLQYGENYTVESSRASFHLDDSGNELRLYVPHQRKNREKCLMSQLPKGLAGYLGIYNSQADLVISNIIKSSGLSIVNDLLSEAGIVEVESVQTPTLEDEDQSTSEEDSALGTPEVGLARLSASSLGAGTTSVQGLAYTPSSSYAGGSALTPTPVSDDRQRESAGSPWRSPSPSPSRSAVRPLSLSPFPFRSPQLPHRPSRRSSIPSSDADTAYAALLNHIIRAASHAAFPDSGSELLHHEVPFTEEVPGLPYIKVAQRTLERDKRIGAAGELLVREANSFIHMCC